MTTLTGEAVVTARLLAVAAQGRGADLAAHVAVHGPLPPTGGPRANEVAAEIAESGLTGRGGAGFPTIRKLELLARQRRRPVLLVNAMEGEPASVKDRVLMARAPHLVLDGAQVAANVIGAGRIVLCVPAEDSASVGSLEKALLERSLSRSDTVASVFARPPGGYAAGEESALVDWVAGGRGAPTFRPDKTVPLAMGRFPALVQNAETLAQLALVARHGAAWFRAVGHPQSPGTTLVTVSGSVPHPGALEVELGTQLGAVLERAGVEGAPRAVLLGGYGGAWIDGADVDVAYAPGPLADRGAAVGAGVIGVLGPGACGVAETARIVGYLARQSAGQCGPCTFGMPALAEDLARLAGGAADGRLLDRLRVRMEMVVGRGACRLPDGAVQLVASALRVFADDMRAHARNRLCPGWNHRPLFPTPATPGRIPTQGAHRAQRARSRR